jgi:hypothetical protein
LLVLFVVSLGIWWWLPVFEVPGGVFDEAMLLVAPELVLQGKVPHRDFGIYNGPANLWTLAVVYKAIGVSIFSERLAGLAYRFGYLLALGWLGRRLAPGMSWAFVMAGVVVISRLGLHAMAWIPAATLGLVSVLCGASAASVPSKRQRSIFLGGVVAGLALLFRPDLGLALTLGWLPILVSVDRRSRLVSLLGALTGLIPMIVHACMASPGALWRNFFLEPAIVGSPGRRLPLDFFGPTYVPFFVILMILAACNVAVALWFFRKNRHDRAAILHLSAAFFGLGMSHQLLQRYDPAHIAMGTLVSIPLLLGTIHRLASAFLSSMVWRNVAALSLWMSLLAFPAEGYFPKVLAIGVRQASGRFHYPHPRYVVNGERTFPLGSAYFTTQYSAAIEFVNRSSQPGEKIFVGQGDLRRSYLNDIFVYHLLLPRLVPCSYFVEMNPLVANGRHSRLAGDLEECDWIVLNKALDRLEEPNRAQERGFDGPVKVLETHFEQVFRSGPITVYRRTIAPS